MDFRAGANYFKGDRVALRAEVDALTPHANTDGYQRQLTVPDVGKLFKQGFGSCTFLVAVGLFSLAKPAEETRGGDL